jgi:hypothetical protein
MLSVTTSTRIFIYTPIADMRKGVDGLSGIIRGELLADPTDGSLSASRLPRTTLATDIPSAGSPLPNVL